MTDGGQIRIDNKVYAEQNHSNTVLSNFILSDNKIVLGDGSKRLKTFDMLGNGILVTDSTGSATFFEVPDGIEGQNKLLATDENGNLVWVEKEDTE